MAAQSRHAAAPGQHVAVSLELVELGGDGSTDSAENASLALQHSSDGHLIKRRFRRRR